MNSLSRRAFLKFGALGLAGLAFRPWRDWSRLQQEWPDAEQLGRNCVGGMIKMYSRPTESSTVVGSLYEDTVVAWLREVVGEPSINWMNNRWVETPNGYLLSSDVQPVKNQTNQPVSVLPDTSLGKGFWAEVTVPYVDIFLATTAPASPWLQAVTRPRLYYGQVMWISDIQTNSQGRIIYRVKEQYSYGDEFWVAAEAFRPITAEEIAPINPEVEEKKVVVDLSHQTLSCLEGSHEVYFCRISGGGKFDAAGNVVDEWATPLGEYQIFRKLVSMHMTGGQSGAGWDTPGIAWTTLFAPGGVAVHSTFWHNGFGEPRSHGCVNASLADAKWVFRWTLPEISYDPGDLTVQWPAGGTVIKVVG